MTNGQSASALRQLRALFTTGAAAGLTDSELLERYTAKHAELTEAAAGAETAFAVLVDRHGAMVWGVCRRVLGDVHEAEDAFQATFLVLIRKAGSVRVDDSLGRWLYGVAHRIALRARSEAERRRANLRLTSEEGASDDPAGEVEFRELSQALNEEVDRLPTKLRCPIELCYLQGMTYDQAAQRLNWPVATVKSRLARGRLSLRERLARRGLAPNSAGVVAALSCSSRAAVPQRLVDLTVRAATSWSNSGFPSAVINLSEGVLKMMVWEKLRLVAVGIFLAVGLAAGALAQQSSKDPDPGLRQSPAPPASKSPKPAAIASAPGQVTVTGTVLMPDGSPAAGAIVESIPDREEPPNIVRTDEAGRFQLQGVFGNGSRLHIRSADGSHLATLLQSAVGVRTAFASPVKLTLAPALVHDLTVLSGGRPVAGAHVVASGTAFRTEAVTGPDGKAHLPIPANHQIQELVAWHPELGVNGLRESENHPPGNVAQLSLLAPAPCRIRVVDPEGKPVVGQELTASVRTEDSDWIVAREIEGTHVRTDGEGLAELSWVPREKLKFVDVDMVGSEWKIDKTDLQGISERIVTVHARRQRTVEGHLVMPEGADAEGILVTGFGFGPDDNGDNPYSRARRDGTFTLRVASEHAYVLGITDLKWASNSWSGVILGRDTWKPAEITLNVYPATPLTVRVTRGPNHDPVADAWVEASSPAEVNWVDSRGENHTGTSRGASGWLRTDAKGEARVGVGTGEQELRLSFGLWDEERKINVTSNEPINVEFHRAWQGERKITGRLMLDGAAYQPSPNLIAYAWVERSPFMPIPIEPKVRADGTFEARFDAKNLSLFFVDRDKRRSGFTRIGLENTLVELAMVSMASYSGTLLDENARPLVDRQLKIFVKTSTYEAASAQQTDTAGRFRFSDVPANVPLELVIRNEDQGNVPRYFVSDQDRLFNPGEIREGDRVIASGGGSSTSATRPPIPLAKRIDNICRDVRPSGMHALIVLQGDKSQNVVTVADQLLDDNRAETVLSYLTIRLDSADLEAEAAAITAHAWPKPAPGEIVLVALDGDQKTIAAQRVVTGEIADAVKIGDRFLKQHRPPLRDAQILLTEARSDAKASGRRVWLVHGGPRCRPCFLLGRWMEEQHATLEKDYVIVKVMDIIDEHVAEVVKKLPSKPGDGIPWFAITEPDGTILATSTGPLGNIGFPNSVEGSRHLRQMLDQTAQRLTPVELDKFIKTLSPNS